MSSVLVLARLFPHSEVPARRPVSLLWLTVASLT